jgi:hypothetical protein
MENGDVLPLDSGTWKRLLRPVAEYNAKAPPALCDLIHRCLAFDAHRRPERVSEVQGALDHLADDMVRRDADKLEALEF